MDHISRSCRLFLLQSVSFLRDGGDVCGEDGAVTVSASEVTGAGSLLPQGVFNIKGHH